MMAKLLIWGGLAIAIVGLLATAIAVASPYLALIIVLYVLVKFGGPDEEEETPQ